jgi:hypothetical protein
LLRNWKPRQDWKIAFAITAALRLLYSAFAAGAAVFVHPSASLIQSNVFTENLPAHAGWHYALLGIWARFDTLWYLHIASHGYDLRAEVVFYPLYPFLTRGLSILIGPMAAALLISTVAAFFYFLGLIRLVRHEFPDQPPLRTVTLAAMWPATFFLFAGYTESLALALIVWCVAAAREERWVVAAACAFAAGLTRSAGTLTIVPLAIIAWKTWRAGRERYPAMCPVLVAPLGTLGYWFWLHQTGRPSVVTAYRTYWSTELASPWTTLSLAIHSLARHFDPQLATSLLALIVFFVAGVAARRRMRIEDRCFSAAVIAQILLRVCLPLLLGTPRYLLPVYPAFITMGNWAERMEGKRFAFLCGALFALNLVWMWAFLSWRAFLAII